MESVLETSEFQCHSAKQEKALFTSKPILVLASGTQFGKTTVGGIRMKFKMMTYTDPQDNFIITAPNYKIMQQSTLPSFLRVMEGLGHHNKTDATFKMNNGGTCYLRTETDPDSVVGIPRVRHIWGDEAGKYCLYFWENIQARADSIGASIDLTTSPYSMNWIFKELIRPAKSKTRDDIELIQAASWENPYHTLHDPEKRARKRATMDPRRFDMIYGGEFGQAAGLVYDCWDDDANLVDAFRLPYGTVYYGGIDWGFTEPFVLTIRAITPSNDHFQVFEFYKTGMTIPKQMELVKAQMQTFNVRRFYCGHERPENILLFNQNGISCEGVPEKDIQVGTDLHYELIKTRTYKVFRETSPYTLDEMATYHYPEPGDLKPDDDSQELKPVGQNDHAMSANRFITLKTYKSGIKKTPYVPGENTRNETNEQRISRLKRPRHSRL